MNTGNSMDSLIPAWTGGEHHGNLAGTDVTDALLNKSPHGDKVLAKLPLVGKLVD